MLPCLFLQGGEGSPHSCGRWEQPHFPSILLSRGTPFVPSKMLEHTCIRGVSGTDPEELQGDERGSSRTIFHFRPHVEWSPPGYMPGLLGKAVYVRSRLLIRDSCCQWDTCRNRSSVWQYRSKFVRNVVPLLLFQHTDEPTASFQCLVQKKGCSAVELKMLGCIYKPNASSSWELEQFL